MNISEEVEKIYPFLVSTRKYLHEHPESSLKEYETSKFIKQELDKINIDYVAKLSVNKKIDVKDINVIKEIRNLLAQKALGEEKISIMLNLKVLEQEINYEPTLEQTSNVNYTTDKLKFMINKKYTMKFVPKPMLLG